MERRRKKRKKVHIEAEIISGSTIYKSIVENISEEGLNMDTDSIDPLSTSTRFTPGAFFGLKFNAPSGEEIILNCRVVWSYKTAPHGLTKKIGMLIVDPSDKYLEFFNNQ